MTSSSFDGMDEQGLNNYLLNRWGKLTSLEREILVKIGITPQERAKV